MTHLVRAWRPAMRVLALALVIAAIPLPAFAGETSQAAPKPGIRASIEKAVAAQTVAPSTGPAVRAQSGTGADLGSPSFFKTPVGIAVVAVLAAGAGYAIYSAKHDRVSSPGR